LLSFIPNLGILSQDDFPISRILKYGGGGTSMELASVCRFPL